MNDYLGRGAGILLPVSSLPSSYGIGTFGKEAYKFVDRLIRARQTYWQVLPLGPTSFGDSPYASFSTFAGNPYFIDLDLLIEEGLLEEEYVKSFDWGDDIHYVSYDKIFDSRFKVLRKAFENSKHEGTPEYKKFVRENKNWLPDYSLYMACKFYFDNNEWQLWDEDIKRRKPAAIKHYREMLAEDVKFFEFVQFKFYEQWGKLKEYANENGIKIIGDIPIYVAMDSADVWANTKLFQLDDNLKPVLVSGVPPDAFSDLGQKWGNPLYDWDVMEADGFKWWKERIASSARLYDVIRIDHFIGVVRYYRIPAEDSDARKGSWKKGPGMKLINAINEAIGDKKIIAEDLGVLIPQVQKTLKKSGYPGMKVLEFAFDGNRENEHLPMNYSSNCVVYGGTHDNETLVGYFKNMSDWDLKYVREYVEGWDMPIEPMIDKIIRLAYRSVASVAIFQLQDILKLGNEARINLPSTVGENWKWRMEPGQFVDERTDFLAYLTDIYGR